MKFASIALPLSTLSLVGANVPFQDSTDHHRCLTQEQANITVTRLRDILGLKGTDLGNLTESFKKIAADDFASTSDSYSMINGNPWQVGMLNTTNKEQELVGLMSAKTPQKDISTIELAVIGCRTIFWFWSMGKLGNNAYPVKGMHLLKLNEEFKIRELYTEVNSFAFGADTGFNITYPNGTALPS